MAARENAENIRNSRYATFLEHFLRDCMKFKPDKIGICMLLPNGEIYSSYFGKSTPADKALMSWQMQADAMFDVTIQNSDIILDAAKEIKDAEEDDDE